MRLYRQEEERMLLKRKDDGMGFWRGLVNSLWIIVPFWALMFSIYWYGYFKPAFWVVLFLLILWLGHYFAKGIIIWRRNQRREKDND
jgi:hypothetical protein